MKKEKPLVSVIIPVRVATFYLKETISYLQKQSFKDFELIIVTDKREKIKGGKVVASGEVGPAQKRNLGSEKAKGEILAFLDDDSYPSENWLKNAVQIFKEDQNIAAVCGPCLTPPKDSVYQKASGWVWGSWFGSGGAGTYRNRICPRRGVDDFPSVNLLVRKKDFLEVDGFHIRHWPGEDTKLCLDLIKKLKKKIIYDPSVLVYHHRRPILRPHLKQISRYALRRGFFAKKFPETSFRLGYWLPTLFVFGLIVGGSLSFYFPFLKMIYLIALGFYAFLLFLAGMEVLIKEKDHYLALLVIISIFATHLWYGLLFPFGFFRKNLSVVLKKVDRKKRKYIGG